MSSERRSKHQDGRRDPLRRRNCLGVTHHQTRSIPVGISQLRLLLVAAVGAVCSEPKLQLEVVVGTSKPTRQIQSEVQRKAMVSIATSSESAVVGGSNSVGNILLRGLHHSAEDSDAASFALAVTLSGVSDGFSQATPGVLDTSDAIAGERSEKSANLVSEDMEGTANAVGDSVVRDGKHTVNFRVTPVPNIAVISCRSCS